MGDATGIDAVEVRDLSSDSDTIFPVRKLAGAIGALFLVAEQIDEFSRAWDLVIGPVFTGTTDAGGGLDAK